MGRRRSAGGQHHADAVRHTPDTDAADAVVRDLSGGDTGAVRLGGAELSRRVRAGAAAHRPAPGGPAGAGGGYRRRRRDPAVPGAEADRLPDRAGHAQRGRHGERHAGGLRRGGRDGDLQRGTGTGDRGLTGLFVRHGRGGAGRGRLGHHGDAEAPAARVRAPGDTGPDRGGHLSVRGGSRRRRGHAAERGAPAPGGGDHGIGPGGLRRPLR